MGVKILGYEEDLFFMVYTTVLLKNLKLCNISLKLLKKKLLEKGRILYTSVILC